MKNLALAWFAGVVLVACGGSSDEPTVTLPPPDAGPADPQIALEAAFSALTFQEPVGMFQAPGDNSRWFMLEKIGRIVMFDNDDAVTATNMFADLTDRVIAAGGEGGLLGMAFHPDFANNRAVFVSYTNNLESRISSFFANAAGTALDVTSETILLTLQQPFSNHNGGGIAFGPDGNLYIAFGDGGSGGDPLDHGQNTDNFFGAFLRINVDNISSYSVPQDNPFAGGGGAAEVWAWGFRNPWRWSFDSQTGLLWAGDVGQNTMEEIDIVAGGNNYGWRCFEGTNEFDQTGVCPDESELTPPVTTYDNPSEGVSVTGGYVYRGQTVDNLDGVYVFGDFGSGTIWGLIDEGNNQFRRLELSQSGLSISSFAEDNTGELYVIDFGAGAISRIVPGS